MKTFLTLLALALFISNTKSIADAVPPANIAQAREVLTTTQAHPNWIIIYDAPEVVQTRPANINKFKIYKDQMEAINLLITTGDVDNIKYLIPFLGYYRNSNYMHAGNGRPRDIEGTKEAFPVFAAMFNIPGAGKALGDYCLDSRNSDETRLTAFEALKFVDEKLFQSIGNELHAKQWSEIRSKSAIIDIEKENAIPFSGSVYLTPRGPDI